MDSTTPNPDASAALEVVESKAPLSPWQLFWRRLRRRKIAMIGGSILIVLYFVAIFAGFFAPYRYDQVNENHYFGQMGGSK